MPRRAFASAEPHRDANDRGVARSGLGLSMHRDTVETDRDPKRHRRKDSISALFWFSHARRSGRVVLRDAIDNDPETVRTKAVFGSLSSELEVIRFSSS